MFRGFVRATGDAAPSVVRISLIRSQHIEYGLFDITEILYSAWYAGIPDSTTLTILLHAVNDLVGA